MSKWLKTTQGQFQVVAFAILVHLGAGNAHSEEQRCTELGASCLCSEPLNTTTFAGGPDFWNPADSTTKQCSVESASPGGGAGETSSPDSASPERSLARNAGSSAARIAPGTVPE